MKLLYYIAVVAVIGALFLIFNAQPALAQDVKIVCSGGEAGPFPYPIGYVATGVTYKEGCGGPITAPNAYIMEKPLGRKNLSICSINEQAIPNGYVIVGLQADPKCFYAPGSLGNPGYTNMIRIAIPDPDPDSVIEPDAGFSFFNKSARRICNASPIPPGFLKIPGTGVSDFSGTCGWNTFPSPGGSFLISRKEGIPAYFPQPQIKAIPNVYTPKNVRLLDFSDGRLQFESYQAGAVTPLNNNGNQDYVNGSVINSGPTYAHTSRFPYVMHDDKRDLILLHPGTFETVKLGASVGYRAGNGKYRFVGMFARANTFSRAGDGVSVGVFKNLDTTPLFTAEISSNYLVNHYDPFFPPGSTLFGITHLFSSGISFDLELFLTEGDVVRFVVFSGPGKVDGTFDVTGLLLNTTFTCPTITLQPLALAEGVAGVSYNQSLSASPDSSQYSYAITKGSLPQGLALNNGIIGGTPTVTGKFTFTITATDKSGCTGTREYALTVNCPAITLPMLPNGTVGTPYTQTITPSGGIAPYKLFISGLPPGLVATITSSLGNVVIAGTPVQSGLFPVSIYMLDANNCEGRKTSTINIAAPPCALVIYPESLPSPVIGRPYLQPLSVNSPGTYTFSLVAGALPPGLQLTKVLGAAYITGTPTVRGTYSFTLKAQVGLCESMRTYTLTF